MYTKNLFLLILSSACISFALKAPGIAGEVELINQIEQYNQDNNSQSQVTNVHQLRDVYPSDWAYEALRSLVDRYGCIVGYPNQTYRGNKAISRYEFAAGLNACLNQIERLVASSEAIMREDLDTLNRLTQEFATELATLGGKVDNLENRTAFLEDNQFSTTTKLKGEVIFAITDSFGENDDNQTVFGDRFRLELDTSFTGKDKLVTRLTGGNLANVFDSPTSTQTFNINNDDTNSNNVTIDWLAYYFPFRFTKNLAFDAYAAAFGGIHSHYTPTLNPYFEDFDGGNGALSTFASESPIYRIGSGSGLAGSFKFGLLDSIIGPSTLTVGYLAGEAGNPDDGAGLFNGDYGLLAQLNFAVSDVINVGLTYVNGYNDGTPTFGNLVGTPAANSTDRTKGTHTYGTEIAWKITDGIHVSTFFAYQDVDFKDSASGTDEVWTWGGGLAFPDLGKEGNVLGIFAGTPPYSGNAPEVKTPIHIEGFYKYQVNDNISITPGVIWVKNPNQGINDEDDEIIGTIRTTFTF